MKTASLGSYGDVNATSHSERQKFCSPEWLELANQKSAEINAAYEAIKAVRKAKGSLFRAAFGGTYGPTPAEERGVDGWEERYVSEYATSATQEDFAETFMLFVKHKGKLPAQFKGKPAIMKKWKAVAEIVKRVAAASR